MVKKILISSIIALIIILIPFLLLESSCSFFPLIEIKKTGEDGTKIITYKKEIVDELSQSNEQIPLATRGAMTVNFDPYLYVHYSNLFSFSVFKWEVFGIHNDFESSFTLYLSDQYIKNNNFTLKKVIHTPTLQMLGAYCIKRQVNGREDITNLFYNEVAFENNVRGVNQASLHYYGKDISSLLPEEAVYLSLKLKYPTIDLKDSEKELFQSVYKEEFQTILFRMMSHGYTDKVEYEKNNQN